MNILVFHICFLLTLLNSVYCYNLVPSLQHIKAKSAPDTQAAAVQDLIQRVIPTRASSFSVVVNPDLNDKDTFLLEKIEDGIIQITATTGVTAAAGFNHYLKYFCNSHISWTTSQLNLPEDLPDVNITIPFNDQFRYYQNVCTTSYSFVWWNWTQWEKHIDWMALNGLNLVLAFNGQEAIWERVYQKFNLTQDEIDEHFTGPGFLSWLRMGNMRGWGGPLSSAWHSKSITLQKQILERMRSLGIIPVLPAFAGHLPRAFKRLYPDAKMDMLGSWNGFGDDYCRLYFLDPTEELFNEIGKAFIEEQIAEFGTDHIYNCDSFNENTPTSTDLTYLSNVGQSIYKAMTDIDPDAIWIMQNWLFVNEANFWSLDRAEALLTSVPIGKMLILDLQSELSPQYEKFDQYYGQPYIWCMLHNFGGSLAMFGSSSIINERPHVARNMENSTMVGIGLTPEGINQNYVIYELMTEAAWRNTPTNLTEWFDNYVIRRYGSSDENAIQAWRILQETLYNYTLNQRVGHPVIEKRPRLDLSLIQIWYDLNALLDAWKSLLAASENLKNNSGYLHDLVDVTREALQGFEELFFQGLLLTYVLSEYDNYEYFGSSMVDMFQDLDLILSSNEDFLVGRWIQSAKDQASDSDEEKLFEINARNQITLWGPRGEILDYAAKQWGGIVASYYAPRWKLFIEYVGTSLMDEIPYNETTIGDSIFELIEEPFSSSSSVFPTEPVGDTVEIARNIYAKWVPSLYGIKNYLHNLHVFLKI